MSKSRVIEFVSRLGHELVHYVHSVLIPVPVCLVAYWLNGVTNWVNWGIRHWLMADFRGFRTHAVHGSFKM